MGPHISIGKVNGTKIGKKNLGKKVDFIFKHGPIRKKNPPKFENYFKWSTTTVKEKIIYCKGDRLVI